MEGATTDGRCSGWTRLSGFPRVDATFYRTSLERQVAAPAIDAVWDDQRQLLYLNWGDPEAAKDALRLDGVEFFGVKTIRICPPTPSEVEKLFNNNASSSGFDDDSGVGDVAAASEPPRLCAVKPFGDEVTFGSSGKTVDFGVHMKPPGFLSELVRFLLFRLRLAFQSQLRRIGELVNCFFLSWKPKGKRR